jgi:hypothetical protein
LQQQARGTDIIWDGVYATAGLPGLLGTGVHLFNLGIVSRSVAFGSLFTGFHLS